MKKNKIWIPVTAVILALAAIYSQGGYIQRIMDTFRDPQVHLSANCHRLIDGGLSAAPAYFDSVHGIFLPFLFMPFRNTEGRSTRASPWWEADDRQ